ncbi:MAG: hypothetical protein LBO66_05955 [Deltaproteobacteria bacterium]|jgi:methyl-accepting chemotaxis protein|nr:hypothetical protein [Deltaproteobacteria bacterium]
MSDGNIAPNSPPPEPGTVVRPLAVVADPAATYAKFSFFKIVVIVFVGIILSALVAVYAINNVPGLITASNDSTVLQWGIGVIIMALGIIVTFVVAFLLYHADTTSSNINVLRSDMNVLRSDNFANFKDFKADVKESVNEIKESMNKFKDEVKESINEVKESINEVKADVKESINEVKESINEVKTSVIATNSRIDNTNSRIDNTNNKIDKLAESYSLLRADVARLEGPYWRRPGKGKRENRSRDLTAGADAPVKGA